MFVIQVGMWTHVGRIVHLPRSAEDFPLLAIVVLVMPAASADAVPQHRQASHDGQELRKHEHYFCGEGIPHTTTLNSISGNCAILVKVNPDFVDLQAIRAAEYANSAEKEAFLRYCRKRSSSHGHFRQNRI
jgi:hypothetical protein